VRYTVVFVNKQTKSHLQILYTKSAKSDLAVREENHGTRKPREWQKSNEVCDCA
jgi:hypothetical protein